MLAKVRREAGIVQSNENDWGKQRLDPLCIFADVFAEGKFAERIHMSTMWTKASEDRIWELIPLECSLRLLLFPFANRLLPGEEWHLLPSIPLQK